MSLGSSHRASDSVVCMCSWHRAWGSVAVCVCVYLCVCVCAYQALHVWVGHSAGAIMRVTGGSPSPFIGIFRFRDRLITKPRKHQYATPSSPTAQGLYRESVVVFAGVRGAQIGSQ